MSLMRPILNGWLRLTEKPHLRRAKEPQVLRRGFETKARFFFHAPRGVRQSLSSLGGRNAIEIACQGGREIPVLLYFHGGGYIFGSPKTHAAMVSWLCKAANARAVLPDYRKAPEDPFPAAVEDAEAAYVALLARGEDPAQIVIGGDSAGGGLALSLLSVLIKEGHPLPAGVFALSPVTDLTYSSDSVRSNAPSEVMLPAERVLEMTEAYIGDRDRKTPTASPLFANFPGAPPIWLCVGDTEILLDDSRNMAQKLREQGVPVSLNIARGLPHVWPIFHNYLPEARQTLSDLAAWIKQQTTPQDES